MLPNTQMPVIIQYIGNHEVYQPSSHGNSKNDNRIFEPAKKSITEKLKAEVRYVNPNIVYKENQHVARNLKQLQNIKYYANRNRRVHMDEICATQLLFKDLNFIHSITTAPDLIVTAYDESLVDEINSMIATASKPVMCTYDYSRLLRDYDTVILRPSATIESIIDDIKNNNLETFFNQKLNLEDQNKSNLESNNSDDFIASTEPIINDVPKTQKL